MRILMSALASVMLVAGAVVPAHAASVKFDVTKLTAKDIVVKSSHYYNTTVTMSHTKSGVGSWDVSTDITKGGAVEDSVFYSSSGNKKTAKSTICPWSNADYGTYRIGPSSVWADASRGYDYLDRDDFTKGSFKVRAHVKTGLTAKRTGSKVTLTATAKRYSLDHWGYTTYSPKSAKLQVKSGSSWKTLKTVKLTKGKTTYTVTSSKAKSYRFVTDASATSASSTSTSIRK
jgi:hypothetical protein